MTIDDLINVDELLREMLKVSTERRPAVPEGTFPPGSKVRKSRKRPGDKHDVGALATTWSFPLGPIERDGQPLYGYIVEWRDMPGVGCFVSGDVIELVAKGQS